MQSAGARCRGAFYCTRKYSRSPNFLSNQAPRSQTEVSDLEWNLRTGRAVSMLKSSLPLFFEKGLVTASEDTHTSIYASNVRLSYTPPTRLPPPLPNSLQVEGLPMYHATASFIRHALPTLYSNLDITIRNTKDHSASPRNRKLELTMIISGNLRVSGKPSEWDVKSTYLFSQSTGLVHKHIIDSIIPAPHQAVYDALRSSILRIIDGPQQDIKPQPCPSTSHIDRRDH